MLVRQHALGRLLRHQEAAIGADRDRVRDVGRDKVDERSARTAAGVVDDEIRRADLALDEAKQPLDLIRLGGVAGIGFCAGLGAERAKFLDLARGQRDANVLRGEQPRQRGAQAFAGADDESDLVFRMFHGVISRGRDVADLCIRRADDQLESRASRSQFRRANCSVTAIMPP